MLKRLIFRGLVIPLSIVVASLWLRPISANAIGFLISANPAIGQELTVPPSSVFLEFSVPSIPAAYSGNIIRVTDSSGTAVEVGETKTSTSTLSVSLRDGLKVDRYQVAFRYVCDDGHVLVSAYNFKIVEIPSNSSPHPKVEASKPADQVAAKTESSAARTPESSSTPAASEEVSPTPASTDSQPEVQAGASPTSESTSNVWNLSPLAVVLTLLALILWGVYLALRRFKKI